MEDSLTTRLHLLSCAQSQTRLNGKLLFTTHSQVMGNELKYQFASLETSLKHLGKSKWQICTQHGLKRGGQPAVPKILQSLYHKSEVVSCIIPYQFQQRPPHFVQENINEDIVSGYPLAKKLVLQFFQILHLTTATLKPASDCTLLELPDKDCLAFYSSHAYLTTSASLLQTVLSIPFANDLC